MKRKISLVVAAALFFAACETPYRATDVSGVTVSSDLQRTFDDQYPTAANVVWSNYDRNVVILNDYEMSGWPTLETNDYVVTFDMNGDKYYGFYDSDGTWIGTAYAISDYGKLPTAVHTTINTQFPSYQITKVNQEFKKDGMAYEVVLKNNDTKVVLVLDNDGKIIKQKTKDQ